MAGIENSGNKEQLKDPKIEVVADTQSNLGALKELVVNASSDERAQKLKEDASFSAKAKEMTSAVLDHFWGKEKGKDHLVQATFSYQDQRAETTDSGNLAHGAKYAINMRIPLSDEEIKKVPTVNDKPDDEAHKTTVETYRKELEAKLIAATGLPEGYHMYYARDTKAKELVIRFLPELKTDNGPKLQKNVLQEKFGVKEPEVVIPKVNGITESSEPLPADKNEKIKTILHYMTEEKKLPFNHALGLIANMERESSFSINVVNSLGATGLFQWLGERCVAMKKRVPNWETNWKGQIDHALTDEGLGEWGPQYLKKMYNTPEEAAKDWVDKWERPGDPTGDQRKHVAFIAQYRSAGLA